MIEQTNQKREQLIKSLDRDIHTLKLEINVLYQQIGKVVYERFSDGDLFVREQVEEYLITIRNKRKEILQLEQKRSEIDSRYGEELRMLSKLLSDDSVQAGLRQSNKVGIVGICPQCSGARMEGDRFCMNCGHKYE